MSTVAYSCSRLIPDRLLPATLQVHEVWSSAVNSAHTHDSSKLPPFDRPRPLCCELVSRFLSLTFRRTLQKSRPAALIAQNTPSPILRLQERQPPSVGSGDDQTASVEAMGTV